MNKLLLMFVILVIALSGSAEKNISAQQLPEAVLRNITLSEELKYEFTTVHKISFYRVIKNGSIVIGYIFDSGFMQEEIRGFNGPICLLIYVDCDGMLKNFTISKSSDTPQYLANVMKNKSRYLGINIFKNNYGKINAVTGATYSSNAVAAILKKAGNQFAEDVLRDINAASGKGSPTATTVDAAITSRESRKIDQQKYKTLIKENKLSEKSTTYSSAQE
jgi:Na+-translocating ferredoxin:NAD+ oxidoreductase RnfG subunit